MKKKKAKVRVNGRTLTSETLQDRGPVISKLEEVLIRWITRDTAISGEIKNITDKIRLGIRISAFRMVLERLKQLCEFNPDPNFDLIIDSGIHRSQMKSVPGSVLINTEFVLGAAVDRSTVEFLKCANMTKQQFGDAGRNSAKNYDLVIHLGSREDFEVFAAYRADESFAHPVIFKGRFREKIKDNEDLVW